MKRKWTCWQKWPKSLQKQHIRSQGAAIKKKKNSNKPSEQYIIQNTQVEEGGQMVFVSFT